MSEQTNWTRALLDAPAQGGGGSQAVAELREAGKAWFTENGWPTTRHEDWRYLDLRPLQSWAPQAAPGTESEVNPLLDRVRGLVDTLPLPADASVFVLVDGTRVESLDRNAGALAGRLKTDSPDLGQGSTDCGDALSAWNAATFDHALTINVTESAEAPICLVNVHTGSTAQRATSTKTFIHVAAGARARLIEFDVGLDEGEEVLATAMTHATLETEARLDRLRVQMASPRATILAGLRARLDAKCHLSNHVVQLGAERSRDEVTISLNGEDAFARFDGLFLGTGKQVHDQTTIVRHEVPNCVSDEAYKGILNDHASGSFTGRIVVAQDAQKTDAYQNNKNLLLSDDAKIQTRPQLEIYADDVKCSHGATTGQLDEDQLFYLQSRGLTESAARELLVLAFAKELLERVEDEALHAVMEAVVTARMTPESSS